jgi:hypothetical protein
MLTNKAYNVVKYLITIFLPAVGALYFALAQVWDFNRISGVNGTINAVITFGGLLIGYSTRQYKKTAEAQAGAPDGDLVVTADPVDGHKYLGLVVNHDSVEAMTTKDQVTLNVVDKTSTDPRMQAPQLNPGGATSPSVHHHEQPPPSAMPTQY